MQKILTLKMLPSEAANDTIIRQYIGSSVAMPPDNISGFHIQKKSLDARGKQVWVHLTILAFINEPFQERKIDTIIYNDVSKAARKVIVIGAGPAGLFAALQLLEKGIQPIIIERGKDVRARRRDLASLNKEGVVNPESNYCFGEGGAGTYSDGKLYTRSNKRGDVNRILNVLVQFGAEEKILYEAHPHIGTNKLPQIITAMRQQIIDAGGKVHFEKKLTDFIIDGNRLKGIVTADGDNIYGEAVILATGHSARDIFSLLHGRNILIEAKPFALGVRIEHPQSLIDSVQYHCPTRNEFLPPASYSLVQQVEEKGVFSFCMCPGGIIAPAATDPGELVVNGWSPSKRNNPFANSGIVVQVSAEDAFHHLQKIPTQTLLPEGEKLSIDHPLLLMYFQKAVEQQAFRAGGGHFVAPAQRMVDFVTKKVSCSLPDCSYLPGIASVDMYKVLPPFISKSLAGGFKAFGQKLKGYYTNDAVIVATESRTSSPVRIPRDKESLEHPQLKGLYPCGEGAGYAGGIVSAAMDGERIAKVIAEKASP